jgi:CRP-like cAMP-binding protein
MISKQELRRMYVLKDIPERDLERIAEVAQLQIYSADSILFRQNEELKYFYMVLSGQISLSIDVVSDVSIILGTVRPGYSCGISAFIPGSRSSSTAMCDESCELICLSAARMSELFEQDWDLAYHFMYRMVRIFKSVMDHRTSIFLKSLENHPDIQRELKDLDHLAPIF